MTSVDRIVMVAYNVVWWVPVALAVFGFVSFSAGAIGFLVMNLFRAVINVYRNNLLPIEAAHRFPLRSP